MRIQEIQISMNDLPHAVLLGEKLPRRNLSQVMLEFHLMSAVPDKGV